MACEGVNYLSAQAGVGEARVSNVTVLSTVQLCVVRHMDCMTTSRWPAICLSQACIQQRRSNTAPSASLASRRHGLVGCVVVCVRASVRARRHSRPTRRAFGFEEGGLVGCVVACALARAAARVPARGRARARASGRARSRERARTVAALAVAIVAD